MSDKEIMQKYFTMAVIGLARQKWVRAMGKNRYGDPTCVWLDENNNRCAIGHMISQDLEPTRGEFGQTIRSALNLELLPSDLAEMTEREFSSDSCTCFLSGVQGSHDSGKTPKEMVERLKITAQAFGLEWPLSIEEETESLS
jgi:hypothetical protein